MTDNDWQEESNPLITTPARYSEIIIGDIPLSFFEIIQELIR
nr:MAG TPA: hypothetical protein [Caudoviricetes sp.]